MQDRPCAIGVGHANPCLSLTSTLQLDPGAVHHQIQRSIRALMRDLKHQCLLPSANGRIIRHIPVHVHHLPEAGHHPGRLPELQLEQDLIFRQNWIAASENTAGRPGLHSGGASQTISLSSQIITNPHLRSEAVLLDLFVVR
jgi:hypothetical protein